MRFLILSLPFCLLPCLLRAQALTISGFIDNAQTGERLYGATVYDLNSKTGVVTNNYGFYSLTLPAGHVSLQVSYVGYQKALKAFPLQSDTIVSFSLSANTELGEITVKAAENDKSVLLNADRLTMNKVQNLPGFLGENDVLKALTQLPGVQQGREGSAGIFVRGGSPDQNLILLDGVPVYNATHFFGFVSVFNPEAIQSVDLYKGNFPARFGGRLSSVIDVRMKEGNKYEPHTDFTLGIISSKITHEGPIKKGKSSYLVSARRTLLDLVATNAARINQIGSDDSWIPGLSFYDVNAKLNFTLDPKNHLYFSLYNGGDRLFVNYKATATTDDLVKKDHTKMNLKWGNTVFASRWNRQINSRLFMNSSLSSGLYNYGIYSKLSQSLTENGETSSNSSNIDYLSRVNTNILKSEFDWYPNNRHKLKFGSETSFNYFIPGKQEINKSDGGSISSNNKSTYDLLQSLFIEDQVLAHDKWRINAGLRYNLFFTKGKIYQNISPRLNVDFLCTEKTTLSFSWAEMFQPIHLLTNNNLGIPSDIWVPATANTPPERSSIQSVSARFNLVKGLNFETAAYYKRMKGVISYQPGYGFMDITEDWETLVTQGKGRAWGFENALNYKFGRLETWANYTLAWNQRKFSNINNGAYFPYKYDRRHDVNLGLIWKLTPDIDVSATWTYQSGMAATVSEQDYAGYPDLMENGFDDFFTGATIDDYDRIQYYNGYNNYRLPAFHHLDIGISRRKNVGKTIRELKLGVYNVYARQNPYMYYSYTANDGTRRYKQVCIFPILPSISYRIIF